ncbi:hypothetical protein LPJ63_003021 [Coemansia sp. RSA 2711]|nr:hypothetical protein LPJ63_003021 [Coemansia sp. RSA 2711]
MPTLPSYNTINGEAQPLLPQASASKLRQRKQGLVMAALSAVLFAALGQLGQGIEEYDSVPPLQVMFWRYLVQAMVALAVCGWLKVKPVNMQAGWKRFRWVVMRAVFGSVGQLIFTITSTKIGEDTATALFYSNTLFVALFAYWLLGERLGKAATCAVVGAALIAMPMGPAAWRLNFSYQLRVAWTLIGAMAVATTCVSIHIAGRLINPILHVFWLSVSGAIAALLFSHLFGEYSWTLAEAGPVVVVRNCDIALTFIANVTFGSRLPLDRTAALGCIVLVASAYVMCKRQ